MPCPTLHELPPPPSNKKGWPWTEGGIPVPETLPDGRPWPKISIVTPSYNQGQFLEETIRSVLLQGYANLEYIIMDGGSSDGSVEIIKRYDPWLNVWVSERDRGQSHAINKGFEWASGEVFGWLNSDDYFQRGGLATLMLLRQENPECTAWVGACQDIDKEGRRLRRRFPRTGTMKQFGNWGREAWIPQPSCLFDAKAFLDAGGLDETLHFVMDVDLWIRLAEKGRLAYAKQVISFARMYDEIKTRKDIPMQQAEHILINFKNGLPQVARQRMAQCMTFALDTWPYRNLLRYFLKRTVIWVWRCFKRLCGR